MEPESTGTGNIAADQTAAPTPPAQNSTGTRSSTKGKPRTATQDSASLSPPGNRTTHQIVTNKSDGR